MDSWHSSIIVKRLVNNILTIFTSVLTVCISAVLVFVLIWHYHLKPWSLQLSWPQASQVAEARSTQKVNCSNPELTLFASVVIFIGVMVWIMVHCR